MVKVPDTILADKPAGNAGLMVKPVALVSAYTILVIALFTQTFCVEVAAADDNVIDVFPLAVMVPEAVV